MNLRKLRLKRPKLIIGGIIFIVLLVAGVFIFALSHDASAPVQPKPKAMENETTKPAVVPEPVAPAAPAMKVHDNIIATVFWVGEAASADNDYIQNRSSAWQEDWVSFYGGAESDENRCGYQPCDFTPKENPFYFALPFNDYAANGQPKSASILKNIPWYNGQPASGTSLLKNRWVKISRGGETVYAQWQDVGPFGEDDVEYVFGNSRPRESRAGIDLSPATAKYLGVDGRGVVSWQFVEATQVPAGPWRNTVTTSGIKY